MIPVRERMCLMESLYDGRLDIAAVALMVDTVMVKKDNEAIAAELEHADGRR